MPRRAIGAGTLVVAAVAIVSTLSPDAVFAFLLNASGALILFVYLLIALAQIRLRTAMQRDGHRPAFAMWLFPGLSRATAAIIVAVLAAMAAVPATRPQIELGTLTVLVVLGLHAMLRR